MGARLFYCTNIKNLSTNFNLTQETFYRSIYFDFIGNLNVYITHLSQKFMHVKRMPIKLLLLVCR